MSGVGNYGATSEYNKAGQDFREAEQETRHARQHFAEAQKEFALAEQDFARGDILGGLEHTLEAQEQLEQGREDLADASQARADGMQHLIKGAIGQALGNLFGDNNGFSRDLIDGFRRGIGGDTGGGAHPWTPPGCDPGFKFPQFPGWLDGHQRDPGFNIPPVPMPKLEGRDPGFNPPAIPMPKLGGGGDCDPGFTPPFRLPDFGKPSSEPEFFPAVINLTGRL